MLSEYSRKLIQLEQKVSNNETGSSHEEPAVTPPPSGRKRPAEGLLFLLNLQFLKVNNKFSLLEDDETNAETPKRKIHPPPKKKDNIVFTMSLRNGRKP